jgi:hypothetical protein
MLLYHQRLTYACLHDLADLLGGAAPDRGRAVHDEVARLHERYGKRVV